MAGGYGGLSNSLNECMKTALAYCMHGHYSKVNQIVVIRKIVIEIVTDAARGI